MTLINVKQEKYFYRTQTMHSSKRSGPMLETSNISPKIEAAYNSSVFTLSYMNADFAIVNCTKMNDGEFATREPVAVTKGANMYEKVNIISGHQKRVNRNTARRTQEWLKIFAATSRTTLAGKDILRSLEHNINPDIIKNNEPTFHMCLIKPCIKASLLI